MKRSYSSVLTEHLGQYRQMIFVVGPRQVGKTTLCTDLAQEHHYFNWDNQDHRALIVEGPNRIGEEIGRGILAVGGIALRADPGGIRLTPFTQHLFDIAHRTAVGVSGSHSIAFLCSASRQEAHKRCEQQQADVYRCLHVPIPVPTAM